MGQIHITKNPDGTWKAKQPGNSRASLNADTQREAINAARDIAINQGLELFVHDENGRFRERNSYGKDPYPPKG